MPPAYASRDALGWGLQAGVLGRHPWAVYVAGALPTTAAAVRTSRRRPVGVAAETLLEPTLVTAC
ncbi:hypothetical protein [Streptomyces chiangmaiensis]|uniref:Uncharacterized protein n=1 Tax=Streptomyces chiangmaiensis TaxID=766497 RepID=A0ABU7FWQ0_9ACTN|nr:hypothetical protein [Streptomyces chiangmaiensis]MED7827958.1 hypothetical protein [Streptomyces chiangmaiensis]